MNCVGRQANEKIFVECIPDGTYIQNERDALDLVAACGEHETHRLLLHAGNLTPDFFDLKTRVAGSVLLRFTIYHMKVAAVIPNELASRGKFGEMVVETNRGKEFRVFQDRDAAEKWLVSDD